MGCLFSFFTTHDDVGVPNGASETTGSAVLRTWTMVSATAKNDTAYSVRSSKVTLQSRRRRSSLSLDAVGEILSDCIVRSSQDRIAAAYEFSAKTSLRAAVIAIRTIDNATATITIRVSTGVLEFLCTGHTLVQRASGYDD